LTESERDVYGLDGLWMGTREVKLEVPEGLERPSYY
jgi:hypothetical protein